MDAYTTQGAGPGPDPTLTYRQYLGLDDVLSAQRPRSGEHPELLFIVAHQIYELWFKQLLHELPAAQEQLGHGRTADAIRTLRRCLVVFKTLISQLDVLETMTPTEFCSFRGWLAASSGFESGQFRQLEAVFGRRDPDVVARYRAGSQDRERIAAAMDRPSLFDSLLAYLHVLGHPVPAAALHRDVSRPAEPDDGVLEVLLQLYRDGSDAIVVCELLVDLDAALLDWRYRHVKMVERIIGSKRGTAGSSGATYLRTTLDRPAFTELWRVRSLL